MKFKVIITYDPEYKGYYVDVPELEGCMSQGKTIDEALVNIKDAISGWIEVEKKHNRFKFNEPKDIFIGEVTIWMGLLSNISGRKAVSVFCKFGYIKSCQTGSHIILYQENKPTLSIPNHKELAPGLLRALLRKSGISVEDFLSNL